MLLDLLVSLLIGCSSGDGAMLRLVMHGHQSVHMSPIAARALWISHYKDTASASCYGLPATLIGPSKRQSAHRICALVSPRCAAAAAYTLSGLSAAGEHRRSPENRTLFLCIICLNEAWYGWSALACSAEDASKPLKLIIYSRDNCTLCEVLKVPSLISHVAVHSVVAGACLVG